MDKHPWITNLLRVEIEIYTGCNLACPNCDRSSAQAKSNEAMTLEQMNTFVAETIELGWQWERITILGGEPTLHPMFAKMLDSLKPIHECFPKTVFRIYSNGFGKVVQRRLAKVPPWIEVCDTQKTRAPPVFSAYNLAPIDFDKYKGEDFNKGCAITERCGLGLTRYGYYPCGAGGSIDRVFGKNIGIKSLAAVTRVAVLSQMGQLCRLCGHFVDFDDRIRNHGVTPITWTREQKSSPTWKAAYLAYQSAPPILSLY